MKRAAFQLLFGAVLLLLPFVIGAAQRWWWSR